MEYEKIKQLMEDMGNSKLTELNIDFPDGMKIRMKKEEKHVVVDMQENIKNDIQMEKMSRNFNTDMKEESTENIVDGNIVKAPMVGTFYAKSSPESEPYVKVGQNVKKGDVLCIVEAMKLMNEIESEFDGEIVEILVKDGETEENGEPLFIIK